MKNPISNFLSKFIFGIRDFYRGILKGENTTKTVLKNQQDIPTQKQRQQREVSEPSQQVKTPSTAPTPATPKPQIPPIDTVTPELYQKPDMQDTQEYPSIDIKEPLQEIMNFLGHIGRGLMKVFGVTGKRSGTTAAIVIRNFISGLPGKIFRGITGGASIARIAATGTASTGLATGAVMVLIIIFIVVFIFIMFIMPANPAGVGVFTFNPKPVGMGRVLTPSVGGGQWPVRRDPVCTDSYPKRRKNGLNHFGIDIDTYNKDMSQILDVYPILDGVVTQVIANDSTFGNAIIVRHTPSLYSLYAHLGINEGDVFQTFRYVKKGDTVTVNTPLARSGTTGDSTGVHLHLSITNKPNPNLNTFLDQNSVLNPCDIIENCPANCVRLD